MLEFLDRTDDGSLVVADIELDDLLASDGAGIADGDRDDVAVDDGLAILEGGVAQTEAEGEEDAALLALIGAILALGVEPAVAQEDVFGIDLSLVAAAEVGARIGR